LRDFEGFICEVHDNANVQSQSDESFQGMNVCIFDNSEHDLRELETKKEWVFNTKRY
jgi:hypothetical protein